MRVDCSGEMTGERSEKKVGRTVRRGDCGGRGRRGGGEGASGLGGRRHGAGGGRFASCSSGWAGHDSHQFCNRMHRSSALLPSKQQRRRAACFKHSGRSGYYGSLTTTIADAMPLLLKKSAMPCASLWPPVSRCSGHRVRERGGGAFQASINCAGWLIVGQFSLFPPSPLKRRPCAPAL